MIMSGMENNFNFERVKMFIAQKIARQWRKEKWKDTSVSRMAPLMYCLELNYKRYCSIKRSCGEVPLSFGRFLLKKNL